MWKILEQAFGRNDTQESFRNSETGIGDSESKGRGLARENSGLETRDSALGVSAQTSGASTGMEEASGKNPETSVNLPPQSGAEIPIRTGESQPVVTVSVPGGESQLVAAVSALEGRVKDALRTVYDPEIPINVYELGLIYDLRVEPTGRVSVQMTLTAPSCPEAQSLPARVEQVLREIPGVTEAKVDLVWDPPWTLMKMSEAARLQLGIF